MTVQKRTLDPNKQILNCTEPLQLGLSLRGFWTTHTNTKFSQHQLLIIGYMPKLTRPCASITISADGIARLNDQTMRTRDNFMNKKILAKLENQPHAMFSENLHHNSSSSSSKSDFKFTWNTTAQLSNAVTGYSTFNWLARCHHDTFNKRDQTATRVTKILIYQMWTLLAQRTTNTREAEVNWKNTAGSLDNFKHKCLFVASSLISSGNSSKASSTEWRSVRWCHISTCRRLLKCTMFHSMTFVPVCNCVSGKRQTVANSQNNYRSEPYFSLNSYYANSILYNSSG